MTSYLWLAPFFPLLGFLVNGFFGKKLSNRLSALIGCAAVACSYVTLAFGGFFPLLGMEGHDREIHHTLYTWIGAGDFQIPLGFLFDPLSITLGMVVSGVGFLIHVYSSGYMKGDPGFARYYAYLNLFTFSMLMLVLADNLLLMFVGWEGVGLCSYLLIGFWFQEDEPPKAGMKAFIVNRIGDVGFALGMFLLFTAFGTLSYGPLTEALSHAPEMMTLWGVSFTLTQVATWAALLLFVGAMGKSAQIPLYVWLPDAMAGPTPVSALIHAATMVTAGIYMVCRMHVLFDMSPLALGIVGLVGGVTAFFAASMALVQRDIKKVLAYSTISQLGYMFLACGAGVYSAGIFHLTTHAFFKALLFLGAGSVIHAMSGEQDIFKMGALKDKMPITRWTFLIATIAIAGIPPLSGFFSKDAILAAAWANTRPWLWGLGAMTAMMTAFYMFRLYFVVFHGRDRTDPEVRAHVHESPVSMVLPLSVLAVLSSVAGFFGIPAVLGGSDLFHHWLNLGEGIHLSHSTEFALMGTSVALALLGFFWAWRWYCKGTFPEAERLAQTMRSAHTLLYQKYYVDEIYDLVLIKPFVSLSRFIWRALDVAVVDGAVNGLAQATRWLGEIAALFQTGRVRHYLFGILLGAVFFIWYFLTL